MESKKDKSEKSKQYKELCSKDKIEVINFLKKKKKIVRDQQLKNFISVKLIEQYF